MTHYALLFNPGHNRVYFKESQKLSLGELRLALPRLSRTCGEVRTDSIADIPYLVFSAEQPLLKEDIEVISQLSFVYAVFEIREIAGEKLLIPIARTNTQFMDDSLSSILKYTGKTNEIFTRMMLNIALFTSDFDSKTDIRLLDPIAGKGTSLFEGLISGYDAYGIEIGDKVVNEAVNYLKKYLETEKYKHTTKTEKVSGPNNSFTATRHSFDISKSKADQKENRQKHFELIAGNSVHADKYFKKNTFHLIVGDLPYGVQHGNVTNEKQSSLTRSPKELLAACLPAWKTVLMPGGTIVLAWNRFVLSRDDMVKQLQKAGFTVFNDGVFLEFDHRVDQAINRDIVVAKKVK
jgi:hypothetical protein